MTTYLLPCSCGQKLEVDSRQAGLTVNCGCGRALEVPAMRGLSQLETAQPAGQAVQTAGGTAWGPAQGLFFLGGLLALVGLAATLYIYSLRPQVQVNVSFIREDMQRITPQQSLDIWEEFRKGLNRAPTGLSEEYGKAVSEYHRFLGYSIILLVLGVLLLGGGVALRQRKPA